jgi:hypothetical protein
MAAEILGRADDGKATIRTLIAAEPPSGFVHQVLGRELGFS